MTPTLQPQAARNVLLATFFVRDTFCALDAATVQEVIRLSAVTRVRHAPPEVAGIVNLRGRIVTILDIGQKLGFPPASPSRESRVFIIEDRNEFIGLLVDRVGEVVEVENDHWQPPPANVPGGQARFFKGVCRTAGRVVAVVNAARILAEAAQ